MGKIEIDRATTTHTGALTALMHASSAYQGDYASILEGYEVTPGYIEANPTFIATADGEIRGFYALADDELDILFVADSAQGLGIGRLLIDHLLGEARARGIRSIRVVSHPPALPFYLRMGARRTGTIPPKPPKARWERPELRFDVPADA
jgi:GNAT superfamily N-acetyltransferase